VSMTRAKIRARSLVGLYRDATIGSMPIEDVRADLSRIGVDPNSAIDAAKLLARSGAAAQRPAVALVQSLEESEGRDADIADIEPLPTEKASSDLSEDGADDIVAGVKDWSEGQAQVEADEAERASETAMLPIKYRRGAILGVGGSLVGIAACVLLFITVRSEFEKQIDVSNTPAAPSLPAASEANRDLVLLESGIAKLETSIADLEGNVAETDVDADADAVADADTDTDVNANAVTAGLATEELGRPAVVESRSALPERVKRSLEEGQAALEALADSELVAPLRDRVDAAGLTVSPGARVAALPRLPDDLTGVFVVDPDRVPVELNVLGSVKQDDQLAAKLGEASLRALGRKVLALIAFERGGERVEAALIEAGTGGDIETETNRAATGANAVSNSLVQADDTSLEGGASEFELLELSD